MKTSVPEISVERKLRWIQITEEKKNEKDEFYTPYTPTSS